MLVFVDSKVGVLISPSYNRGRTASALLNVANEHGKAICLLVESQHYASAFSLLRIQFETFIRAVWLHSCATDNQLNVFIQKDRIEKDRKNKLESKELVLAVETSKNFPAKLSEVQKSIWKSLNSYTHGGIFQAAQRFDGESIGPNISSERVDDAVQVSALLTFLSFLEIIEITENEDNLEYAKELAEEIKSWVF